jgi:hypothetical protein
MEKQTSVKWLEKELIKRFKRSQIHYTNSEWCFDMIKKLSEQAKEKEKHQIMKAYDMGNQNQYDKINIKDYININEEQYYNEIFIK